MIFSGEGRVIFKANSHVMIFAGEGRVFFRLRIGDAFKLLEESCSPKKLGARVSGNQTDSLTSRWRISKKLKSWLWTFKHTLKDIRNSGHALGVELSKLELKDVTDESCKDPEAAVRKLSLTSTCDTSDLMVIAGNPFAALLAVCGQTAPSNLANVFSKSW
ncbi:hypothetical protein NL676_030427 [Syzygium grande]|nr:hypothetical protein NL676_030427 [Syzygium grande]